MESSIERYGHLIPKPCKANHKDGKVSRAAALARQNLKPKVKTQKCHRRNQRLSRNDRCTNMKTAVGGNADFVDAVLRHQASAGGGICRFLVRWTGGAADSWETVHGLERSAVFREYCLKNKTELPHSCKKMILQRVHRAKAKATGAHKPTAAQVGGYGTRPWRAGAGAARPAGTSHDTTEWHVCTYPGFESAHQSSDGAIQQSERFVLPPTLSSSSR